jgi:hypothetical protein
MKTQPFRVHIDDHMYSGCWRETHGQVYVTSAFGSDEAPAGEDARRTAQALLVRIVERLRRELRDRPRRSPGSEGRL